MLGYEDSNDTSDDLDEVTEALYRNELRVADTLRRARDTAAKALR